MTQEKKQKKPKPKIKGPIAEGMDPRSISGPQDWRDAFVVKRVPGAPLQYDQGFHPQSYIDLAKKGLGKAQICASWGISRDTLHRWQNDKRFPEFSDAIKAGDEARTGWWSNFSSAGTTGKMKGFQQTMCIYLMNNICSKDFKARVEHTHGLSIEDMDFGSDGEGQ